MKLFKLLFSRLTIIGVAIILQILLLFGAVYLFEGYYFAVQIVLRIFSVFIVLHIINRDMIPDAKLPWLIFVLVAPVFGVVSYIMFSQNKISFRQRRLYRKIESESAHIMRADGLDNDKRQELLGDFYGQSEYLYNSGAALYTDTDTQYFGSGESFWQTYLVELNKAKKFIFLEYFIIEQGKMWDSVLAVLKNKLGEGVEVRVMYDDIGSISKVPALYYRTLRSMGIKCVKFNRFTPIVSAVHNNRDHRKITVIDGITGFTGGLNLADEYINATHPFGYWKDSAVMLRGEGVRQLTLMFLQSYCVQSKRVEDFTPYLSTEFPVYPGSGFVQPFGTGPKPIFPDYIGEDALLNLINQAKRYLYITTPYLIIDYELTNALQSAAKRGVDVRIITPHIPDKKTIFYLTRSHYKPLMDCGVKIYEFSPGFIHSKNILADDETGIVGTINLDFRSLMHHYECGVWMCRTAALKQLKDDFERTFEHCELHTHQSVGYNAAKTLLCKLIVLFAPLL